MGPLQRLEQGLERLISGVFARAFRSAVQPVEISAALAREVDNSAQILSRNRRLVPNDFHVELSAADHERLVELGGQLTNELAAALQNHAATQSYVFTGPIHISLEHADDLTMGRFRVRSKALAEVSQPGPQATDTQVRQASALLEVNGENLPLQPPGIVIGRGRDVDLRIDDPGVSRRHLEVRVTAEPHGSAVSIHDLGSTNGVLVDNKRVRTATLHNGSTIRIGNTTLTFHQVQPVDGG